MTAGGSPSQGSNRLAILAAEIRSAHTDITAGAFAMAERIVSAGTALREVKASVPHGRWERWLEENTSLSSRTARRYMRIAKAGLKTDTVAKLGLRGALKELAGPRLPKAGQVVLATDQAGRRGCVWRADHGGRPYFHCLVVDVKASEEAATRKPVAGRFVSTMLEGLGLDLGSASFDAPSSACLEEIQAERREFVTGGWQ